MNVKTLKKMLKAICDDGYGNWEPHFCISSDEWYTINHIYVDNDGDVCLQSSDCEDDPYDFTAWNILKTADMKNHFTSKSWYTPRYNDVNSMLTDIETQNIKLIQSLE